MKKVICIVLLAIMIGLITAQVCYCHRKKTEERVINDFRTCLRTQIGHEFEILFVEYSKKAAVYTGKAVDLITKEDYKVYYIDEEMNPDNVGFYNCSTGKMYRPIDEEIRLDTEKAEKIFLKNTEHFNTCAEFFEQNPAVKRVHVGYIDSYVEWSRSWNDTNTYRFQLEFNNIVFELDDEEAFYLIDKAKFCTALSSLNNENSACGITVNSSQSGEKSVDFLFYLENTGYSLHIVYDAKNTRDKAFPRMHTEKDLGNGWYITTINKELIE